MSKYFKKEEILGYTYIDGRKVTVLKTGVRRKNYNDHIDDEYLRHINDHLINKERLEKYYIEVLGMKEFELGDGE
jgi:hypothetical protein